MDESPPIDSENQQGSAKSLLLTSLAEFWSVIEPLLLEKKPQSICEIGIGGGDFARCLINYCAKNSCGYTGIDVAVDEKALPAGDSISFLKKPSLDCLPTLAPHDVYFVDGDHNYYTVLNELRLILRAPERWPLIFVHDVGQPWGRRDHYCAPDGIPAEFLHEYSTMLGVVPGRSELAEHGFSGAESDYSYGAAMREGGPRNGVLTAVEDFLREPQGAGWRCVTVPGVFGLGILYAPEKSSAAINQQVDLIEKSSAELGALLDTMETNRLELVLAHLKCLKDWNTLNEERARVQKIYETLLTQHEELRLAYEQLTERSAQISNANKTLVEHATGAREKFDTLNQQYGTLDQHNAALDLKYKELLQHCEGLQKAYDELKSSPAISQNTHLA